MQKQANDWHREVTSHELQHALDQMYHVSWQYASVIWFLNGLVTPSTHGRGWGFSLSNHLACARVLICLFERAPGNAREQIQSSCYCRVTGRVSLGGCDGQSSYLWFKDWRGSELRRFSSEGNIKAAFRFVLPACFALSFLNIFFFLHGNMSLPREFNQRHYLPCVDRTSPPQANNSCFPWRCTTPLWPHRHLLGLISRRSRVVFNNKIKRSKQ